MFALFINAAILIVVGGDVLRARAQDVAEIQDAYKLLSPMLGVPVASTLFALALLASGQNSTLTGTLAGQIVMEGFLQHPAAAVAAPADHAAHRDHSGRHRHGALRRERHGAACSSSARSS